MRFIGSYGKFGNNLLLLKWHGSIIHFLVDKVSIIPTNTSSVMFDASYVGMALV